MSQLTATLGANALSCFVFGVLFILAPASVASFLGSPPAPTPVIVVLGAALPLNAIHLAYVARTPKPSRRALMYFSAGDFLWAAATLALILTETWITSPGGMAAAVAVALVVALFGYLQWRNL